MLSASGLHLRGTQRTTRPPFHKSADMKVVRTEPKPLLSLVSLPTSQATRADARVTVTEWGSVSKTEGGEEHSDFVTK